MVDGRKNEEEEETQTGKDIKTKGKNVVKCCRTFVEMNIPNT